MTAEELRERLGKLGGGISGADIEAMLKVADEDGDGEVIHKCNAFMWYISILSEVCVAGLL